VIPLFVLVAVVGVIAGLTGWDLIIDIAAWLAKRAKRWAAG